LFWTRGKLKFNVADPVECCDVRFRIEGGACIEGVRVDWSLCVIWRKPFSVLWLFDSDCDGSNFKSIEKSELFEIAVALFEFVVSFSFTFIFIQNDNLFFSVELML